MSNNNPPGHQPGGGSPWMPADNRLIAPSPRTAGGRSISRSSTPGTTMGQGQSYNDPSKGSERGLLGSGPSSTPITRSPLPAGTKRSRGFPSLAGLRSVLDHGTNALGPLKAAINEVADYIGTFERVSSAKKEYQKLHDELDALFETLRQYWSEGAPPAMTSSIECLCNEIRRELRGVDGNLKRRRLERITEASVDSDEIMKCYDRVRDHLRRISLNADMSTWKILDESITDTRLRNMSPSLSACYNSAQATELKRGPCIANTRVEVLGRILEWIDNSNPGSVYWMSGMAGTGKTTIAYSLCNELDNVRRLAANFFCSRTLPECRNVNLIIPSIAYQLARSSYPFRRALSDALGIDPDAHTRLPHLQFDTLISQPLLQVADTLPHNLVVIIDALDECENKDSTSQILDVMLTRALGLPVKFVVSSRPEPEIREEMTKQTEQAKSRLVLHELDTGSVQADIEIYLRIALTRIQPNDDQIAALVQRAGVLFIYAATVVRYIGYNNFRGNCRARLENVLNSSNRAEKKDREIDELYSTILQSALENPDLETTDINEIRQVLHTVICAQEPLTINLISEFLRMGDVDRVNTALEPLWSVLHISGSSELVTTLHASFPDFMLDSSRSRQYHCDPLVHNQTLALRCFDYFRDIRPQFNICNLNSSFVLDEKVAGLEERVKNRITEEVFYAARYWASHLCSANGSPNLIQELEEFLSVRLLLWMEVMNLKKCTGSMPGIIRRLEKWDVDYPASLIELIRDGLRFVTTFSSNPVSASTPHIYTSMLSFWPESGPVSKLYRKYTPRLIELEGTAVGRLQRALLADWHYKSESSMFSPDGSQIAARVGGRVVLLNASTGQIELSLFTEHPFKHSDIYQVGLVQFSPNGTLLVSAAGSSHSGFCIWNVKGGKQLVQGDIGPIYSTAFSPDETRIAFGSKHGFVYILDAHTGQDLIKLIVQEGIQHKVIAVKYSPNGCHLVACDTDGNIVKWDEKGKQVHKTCCQFEGHSVFRALDISPNCTQVATGCQGNIHTWGVETGQATLGPLHIPNINLGHPKLDQVSCLSYSPDGLYLVSGSFAGDVCMWDAQTGSLLRHFPGAHKYNVHSVNFSPDSAYIMSGGWDDTIRLWDTRAMQVSYDPLPGHKTSVTSVGFSPDGSRIVSGAMGDNVCVWNAETGELVFEPMKQHPIEKVDGGGVLVAYSSDGTRIMALTTCPLDSLPLARGDVLYPVHRSSRFTPVVLSEHSTCHLSALSSYPVQVLVSNTSDTVLFIFPPTEDNFDQVSADMVSGRLYNEVENRDSCFWEGYGSLVMYDACSGDLLSELPKGWYIDSCIMQFSPGGAQVVRGDGSSIVVYDIRSGDVILGPLEGHTADVTSIHWSPDGTRIVSGADDNSIFLWDAQTGQRMLGPVKWHTGWVWSVRFSPDSTRVVSGSDDKTIRVTDIRMWADIVSDSPTPTGSDWELNKDG